MRAPVPSRGQRRRPRERRRFPAAVSGASHLSHASRLRIVLVGDHPLTLAGLYSVLRNERDVAVVARCADGHEAVRAARKYKPDIMVVDQDVPGIDGVAILRQLRATGEAIAFVLLAVAPHSPHVVDALSLAVEGVVLKNSEPERLIHCLREVHAGRRWVDPDVRRDAHRHVLTRRQIEIARSAAAGLTNKEIAERLDVAEGTVKNHLHAIYARLQIDGRLALVLYLKDNALV